MERQWLPEREGYSLYIRPFMFSSSHSIGIGRPTRSTIAVMLSPVGPYFQTGTATPPDSLLVATSSASGACFGTPAQHLPFSDIADWSLQTSPCETCMPVHIPVQFSWQSAA